MEREFVAEELVFALPKESLRVGIVDVVEELGLPEQ